VESKLKFVELKFVEPKSGFVGPMCGSVGTMYGSKRWNPSYGSAQAVEAQWRPAQAAEAQIRACPSSGGPDTGLPKQRRPSGGLPNQRRPRYGSAQAAEAQIRVCPSVGGPVALVALGAPVLAPLLPAGQRPYQALPSDCDSQLVVTFEVLDALLEAEPKALSGKVRPFSCRHQQQRQQHQHQQHHGS